ncbi:MAG: hypothetical protein HYU39_08435 [Thaumarchaeota archaeon]|nr:hypothetical protein [Nitrososphaerota archaeon]
MNGEIQGILEEKATKRRPASLVFPWLLRSQISKNPDSINNKTVRLNMFNKGFGSKTIPPGLSRASIYDKKVNSIMVAAKKNLYILSRFVVVHNRHMRYMLRGHVK